MPSRSHQWLVTWVTRKMAQDGFHVTNVDGRLPQSIAGRPAVGRTGRFRPDAVGYSESGEVALGEAKTANDICCLHTAEQLKEFAGARSPVTGREARIYVGVPWSGVRELDRVLGQADLLGSSRVVRIHVPDCFLESDDT